MPVFRVSRTLGWFLIRWVSYLSRFAHPAAAPEVILIALLIWLLALFAVCLLVFVACLFAFFFACLVACFFACFVACASACFYCLLLCLFCCLLFCLFTPSDSQSSRNPKFLLMIEGWEKHQHQRNANQHAVVAYPGGPRVGREARETLISMLWWLAPVGPGTLEFRKHCNSQCFRTLRWP